MAIEEPKYTVESSTPDYEIRKYPPILVAETLVEGDFDSAGGQAFRVLADYIFGNNKAKTKIAMTAPVSQQSSSEKIAMTAPVSQQKKGSFFLVQFTMPGEYTMKTIPEPVDPRVVLREIPQRRVAVHSYSGTWSEGRYQEKLAFLREALRREGIDGLGEATFARYNSPYQLWFLRRNEIWLQLP